jgi:hypothetical protein
MEARDCSMAADSFLAGTTMESDGRSSKDVKG